MDYHINNPALKQFEIDDYLRSVQGFRKKISRVAGYAGSRPVGDFCQEIVCCATIAKMAGAERTVIIYRDDRPYKKAIASLFDGINFMAIPENGVAPLDWFDVGYSVTLLHEDPEWYANLFHYPDLFFVPAMRQMLAHFSAVIPARIPETDQKRLADKLKKRGVAENQWFVCFHLREPNYQFRGADPSRDADVTHFQMAALVIEGHGGQVVRIGHPGVTPLGIPNEISLEHEPFEVQAYALSRSRFNVMSDTGMTTISTCLMVPTLIVNGYTKEHVKNDFDRVLMRRAKMADGRVLNLGNPIFYELGFPDIDRKVWPMIANNNLGKLLSGLYMYNTPEEVTEAVQIMLSETEDISGWHTPRPAQQIHSDGQITFPLVPALPKAKIVNVSQAATSSDLG